MPVYRNVPPGGAFDNPADTVPGRHTNYGDAYTNPVGLGRHNLADEGSYFSFITPTPGTGIVDGVVTTFVETTPNILIYNGSNNKRLVMDFIRLTVTVAPAGGTRVRFTTTIDDGNRYTSGGTALTINNTNMDSTVSSSGVSAYKGAITATAASGSRRVVADTMFRWGTIGIVGDVYELVFGEPNVATITPVATVATFSKGLPPVVIGPGDSLVIVQWEASQSTAPTHAVEGGFWLR